MTLYLLSEMITACTKSKYFIFDKLALVRVFVSLTIDVLVVF